MAKQNKLTVSRIKQQHQKEFGKMRKVTLSSGDTINIHSKFEKSKIQDMMLEYLDCLNQLKGKGVTANVFRDISFVFYMLLIRNFTDLDIVSTDVEEMIVLCRELTNLNLLEEIINSFDQTELEKVNDVVSKIGENAEDSVLGKAIAELFVQEQVMDVEVIEQKESHEGNGE